jgi:hypothetical protein
MRQRDWLDDFEVGLRAASRLSPAQEAAIAAEWAKNVNASNKKKENPMSATHPAQHTPATSPVHGSEKKTKKTKAERQAAMKNDNGLAARMAASLEKKAAKTPVLPKTDAGKKADVAVKKAEDAIARVALSKQPKIAAVAAEEAIEKAAKAVDAAIAASVTTKDAPRPTPKTGQIWSAASKNGRRFIRIEDAKATGEDAHVTWVEVTDATGLHVAKKSKSSPFKGEIAKTKLDTGEMPTSYRFEGRAEGKTEKAPRAASAPKAPREKIEKVAKPKNAETPKEEQIVSFIGRFKRDNPKGLCSQARRAFNSHGYMIDGKPVFAGPGRFRGIWNETKAAK